MLAGSLTLSLGGLALTIPGYMFWVAVLYSGFGSILAHLVACFAGKINGARERRIIKAWHVIAFGEIAYRRRHFIDTARNNHWHRVAVRIITQGE